MRGKAVFYPIGWDDNGLPTERRVQNYFHVQCDPALRYDPSFVPPDRPAGEPVRDLAAQLRGPLRAPDQPGRAVVRAGVAAAGPVGGLVHPVPDHRPRRPGHLPARLPAQPGPGRGVPGRGPDAVGRDVPDRGGPGRTGRPGDARQLRAARVPPPGRQRGGRGHHPARTAARLRGAGRAPRRRAVRGLAQQPIHIKVPITCSRHEFRLALGTSQGSTRAAAPLRSAPRPPPATAA